eukprot:764421-Hanusia_phi.AAC.5
MTCCAAGQRVFEWDFGAGKGVDQLQEEERADAEKLEQDCYPTHVHQNYAWFDYPTPGLYKNFPLS